jgi:purine-binding chemotaxis protein CheW
MNADSHAILRQRAALLARELPREEEAGALLEVVEFSLGRERYAFAAEHVREVVRLEGFSPLPCTPPWVAGIMNVRGQILTLIDLGAWLDLPASGLAEKNDVILLRSLGERPVEVGVLADAILGVSALRLDTLQASLATLSGARAGLLRGVTVERLIVLDAAKLLSDEALLVREEAGL